MSKSMDPWMLFAELLEKRARFCKERGLDQAAVALIGASTDATAVAEAIGDTQLDVVAEALAAMAPKDGPSS